MIEQRGLYRKTHRGTEQRAHRVRTEAPRRKQECERDTEMAESDQVSCAHERRHLETAQFLWKQPLHALPDQSVLLHREFMAVRQRHLIDIVVEELERGLSIHAAERPLCPRTTEWRAQSRRDHLCSSRWSTNCRDLDCAILALFFSLVGG